MVIGLCGKACSGKDQVGLMLEARGWHIIHADLLGREALIAKEEELVHGFTEDDIFDNAGKIDRAKLGKLVFSNKKKLQLLNAIMHPYIVDRIHEEMAQHAEKNIVVNAALLPIVPVEGIDWILEVKASLKARIERARVRDKRGWRFILHRIWAQRELRPQLFWKNVDNYSIENNKKLADLETSLEELLSEVMVDE